MKIAVNAMLIEPGQTGGGETFLVSLMQHIARSDDHNRYLIFGTDSNHCLFCFDNARFQFVSLLPDSSSRVRRVLAENFTLPAALRKLEVDLFFSPFGTLPRGVSCRSVVAIQNLLYFDFDRNVSYHGRSLKSRATIFAQAGYTRSAMKAAVARADHVWAVSQTTADIVKTTYHLPDDKISVIYEGVDSSRSVDSSPAHGRRFILCVATLYPNKNIDKLISAYASIASGTKDVDLLLIGGDWHDYAQKLRSHAATLGVADRVHFLGAVPRDELPRYYRAAEMLVLFSNVESFGLPVLEAMAHGTPVVISASSSLPEIAGDAALLARAGSVGHLAKQMNAILCNAGVREHLAQRGKVRAAQFGWQRTAEQAIALFERIGASYPIRQRLPAPRLKEADQ